MRDVIVGYYKEVVSDCAETYFYVLSLRVEDCGVYRVSGDT